MSLLYKMLQSHQPFADLPMDKKEIYLVLAKDFESNEYALYQTPQELTDSFGKGNKAVWQEFLNLEPTRQYIKGQIANTASIASRKAIKALENEALNGDVQAAKQINEISGILNRDSNNRTVVLHQIHRPTQIPKEE